MVEESPDGRGTQELDHGDLIYREQDHICIWRKPSSGYVKSRFQGSGLSRVMMGTWNKS